MTQTYQPIPIPATLAHLKLPADNSFELPPDGGLDRMVDEYLELSPHKLRDQIRFLERVIGERQALRDEQCAHLLQTVCELNTALLNMEPCLWTEIDEIARKEVASLLKSRREVYQQQNETMNRAWKDLHELQVELLEARQQYESLKKQSMLLGTSATPMPMPLSVEASYGGAAPTLAAHIP